MRALTVLSLSLLIACTGGEPAAPTTTPDAAPETAPASAPTAAGEADAPAEADGAADAMSMPDMAMLDKAKGLARAMMPKKALLEAVNPVLGEPTAMTDTEAHWMGKDGDGCKMLKVTLMGDMVGNASIADAECPAAH